MMFTRLDKIEQLLTEFCRRALGEIDEVIQSKELYDFEFDQNDEFIVYLTTSLDRKEEYLVTEVLVAAGWKNVTVRDGRVSFYF